jgi:hypothetical protein
LGVPRLIPRLRGHRKDPRRLAADRLFANHAKIKRLRELAYIFFLLDTLFIELGFLRCRLLAPFLDLLVQLPLFLRRILLRKRLVVPRDKPFVGLAFEDQNLVGRNIGCGQLAFAVILPEFGPLLLGVVLAILEVGEIAIRRAADNLIRILCDCG